MATGNEVTLRADGTARVEVNGQAAATMRLSNGDLLTVGKHRLRFDSRTASGPIAPQPSDIGRPALGVIPDDAGTAPTGIGIPAGSGALVVLSGPYLGMTFALFEGAIVGRDPRCDIALVEDTMASRQHARFVRDGAFWRIEDGGSTNGTYVNGQRISISVIHPGDQVAVGNTLFQLVLT